MGALPKSGAVVVIDPNEGDEVVVIGALPKSGAVDAVDPNEGDEVAVIGALPKSGAVVVVVVDFNIVDEEIFCVADPNENESGEDALVVVIIVGGVENENPLRGVVVLSKLGNENPVMLLLDSFDDVLQNIGSVVIFDGIGCSKTDELEIL